MKGLQILKNFNFIWIYWKMYINQNLQIRFYHLKQNILQHTYFCFLNQLSH